MRKKSIELWEKRYRRWKQNKDTNITCFKGKKKLLEEFEEKLKRAGILKPGNVPSYKVYVKMGPETIPTSFNAYFGAKYPIIHPRYLMYLTKEIGRSGDVQRLRKNLINFGFENIKGGRRSSGVSVFKLVQGFREMFERRDFPRFSYYVRIAKRIYSPEIIDAMIKEIGGKPTAFLVKKFRYAQKK